MTEQKVNLVAISSGTASDVLAYLQNGGSYREGSMLASRLAGEVEQLSKQLAETMEQARQDAWQKGHDVGYSADHNLPEPKDLDLNDGVIKG